MLMRVSLIPPHLLSSLIACALRVSQSPSHSAHVSLREQDDDGDDEEAAAPAQDFDLGGGFDFDDDNEPFKLFSDDGNQVDQVRFKNTLP
jgi:hypothetical protein